MIIFTNVFKVFGTGVAGLDNITLEIKKGEFVFLIGKTGSGKTTLLRLLIREMLPTKGSITIASVDITKLPSKKIPHLRKKIGVIFQDLKLLADRTIFENVILPLEIVGIKSLEARMRTEEILGKVNILEHRDKFPIQLSGGELQRVAIARALILSPEILLADEPTGNLDDKTAFDIVKLLADINKTGTTVIMATHNLGILKAYQSNRVIRLENGKVKEDTTNEHVKVKTETNNDSIESIITVADSGEKKKIPHLHKTAKEEKKHGKTD